MIVDGSKIGGEIIGKDLVRLYVQTDIKTAEIMLDKVKKDKKYSFEIKQHRQKRSLDANAYMWVLCDRIAEVLKSTKEEVYQTAISEVGAFADMAVKDKDVDDICRSWVHKGTGWVTEYVGDTAKPGGKVIRFYKGSSEYDSKQMARLIDHIVTESKEAGVETMTPDEIERMKQQWGR